MLSVVIPAYNEEGSIKDMVSNLNAHLSEHSISHEIVVINDNSKDNTPKILQELTEEISELVWYTNDGPNGFGYAVRYGLDRFKGDAVAIMMADESDSPGDLVKFYRKLEEGHDCVFGSRFSKGGKVYGYPKTKLIINRIANLIIMMTIGIKYNDSTNAFKLYKKEVIDGVKPFLSPHFNLTIEIPLKAIIRGFTYTVVPNSWTNRKHGKSNLKIKEMGSRYFFILLYCLIEKFFSRGDFKRKPLV